MAAGAVGYGAGTVISKNFVEGTDFGDKLGETIAKTLAFFGNDEAKAALEAQAAYDAMLSEQQQANKLSQDAISEFRAMRSDLSNFANRPLNFNLPGGSLAESFGRPATASSQENRHGAPKPFMLTHTGR